MEENMLVYGIIEKRVAINNRSRTISSDSEDLGLTIDLDEELLKDDQGIGSKKCNKAIDSYVDDELCIGCEENETSVNFFVTVEKAPKPKPKPTNSYARSSDKAHKRFNFKLESSCNEKQDKVVIDKDTDKKNKKLKVVEIPLNKCPKCDFESEEIELNKHLKSCNKMKYFNCFGCPYSTKNLAHYRKHLKNHCLENATYKCKECSYRSNRKLGHRQHMLLHDSITEIEEEFQCPLCPFAKSYLQTLAHFKAHAMPHKYLKNIVECPLCRMKTKSSNFGRHSKHHITFKTDSKSKWKKHGLKPFLSRKDKQKKNVNSGDEVGDEVAEKAAVVTDTASID